MATITVTEQQLETWAKFVQLNKNTATYNRIKSIFKDSKLNDSCKFEIYLQGSVANKTNIWADGDIDIVFQFNGVFNHSSNVSYSHFSSSDYDQIQFRFDIKEILDINNISYEEKNKCIKVYLDKVYYQDVDLIPCFQYRNHISEDINKYAEGIIIKNKKIKIINYPKQHKKNGEEKNDLTNCNYKKIVRIFKNIKKNLVEENFIDEKLAPSYFIECLLYNIPNEKFNENNFQSILANCLNWIKDNNLKNLKCGNRITNLFGNDSTQWNLDNCNNFRDNVIDYITR